MDRRRYTCSPGSPPPDAGVARAPAPVLLALAAAAIARPSRSRATAGPERRPQLNSQIASAQSQAQSLAAEIDAKAAQVAAARSAGGWPRPRVRHSCRRSWRRASSARPSSRSGSHQAQAQLAKTRAHLRRALDALSAAPRLDLQGRRAGRDRRCCSAPRASTTSPTAPSSSAGSRTPTPRSPPRVRQLRDQVAAQLAQVKEASAAGDRVQPADRHRPRPDRPSAPTPRRRPRSSSRPAQQQAAAVSSLRSQVAGWEQQVTELQQIEAQQSQQVAAAQAQQTVSDWVGDWAIPEAIVMCESGGNFNAVNPSSGAGGAYQILPSTWRLYGGSGAPQDASPQHQSQVAAQIWADSGASAWECAQ